MKKGILLGLIFSGLFVSSAALADDDRGNQLILWYNKYASNGLDYIAYDGNGGTSSSIPDRENHPRSDLSFEDKRKMAEDCMDHINDRAAAAKTAVAIMSDTTGALVPGGKVASDILKGVHGWAQDKIVRERRRECLQIFRDVYHIDIPDSWFAELESDTPPAPPPSPVHDCGSCCTPKTC